MNSAALWNTMQSAEAENNMAFPCDQCGLCCKNLGHIPELSAFDNGNGRCIHLTDENLCKIYAQRPLICNVRRMYLHFFHTQYTWEEWLQLNSTVCIALKEKASQNESHAL